MKRRLLVTALVISSMLLLSGASADRTKCCRGCGSYAATRRTVETSAPSVRTAADVGKVAFDNPQFSAERTYAQKLLEI
jgi:hypothetical protein